MADTTKNLGLTKPHPFETYNINVFNSNFQKIDDFAGRKDNPHNVTAEQTGALPIEGGTIIDPVLGLGGGSGWVVGSHTYSAIVALMKDNPNNTRMLRVINPDLASYTVEQAAQFFLSENGRNAEYNLFGEHNKPTVTYMGNGLNTAQSIAVGGIGNVVLIEGGYYIGLAWNMGALIWSVPLTTEHNEAASTYTYAKDAIKFTNGVLTYNATKANNYLNYDGTVYTCYVL